MSSLPAEIAVAAALFAGTNADDVVVLALLSASSRATGQPRRWDIWGGQYAGFTVLAGVSLAVGLGFARLPQHWLWPLALVPLGLGLALLVRAVRSARRGERPAAPSPGGLVGVAGLTIANGADNLASYPPFFAASGPGQVTVTVVVFAAGVAVWCLAGWLLAGAPRVRDAISRYGHWILPAAFIAIGLYTLHQAGALG
jgi:cadmium resistance protein CadD (predicted permease)